MKDRSQKPEARAEEQKCRSAILTLWNKLFSLKSFWSSGLLVFCSMLFSVLSGCAGLKDAREIKSAPMPSKYIEMPKPERAVHISEGSLWVNRASFYEDRRARRVNDLVTVLVNERSVASKRAATDVGRESSADYRLTDFFGMNTDFGINNIPMVGGRFSPTVRGQARSEFDGEGDTRREGRLIGTITATVVEVLPNSNLVIESRKEVVVNNEKEILVLKGIVRPDDISHNNTVFSQYVANAQIYFVGDGVLGDKQSPGWLVRFLDKAWPF